MPGFLQTRIAKMKTLNKPLIIGEVGFQECSLTTRRDMFKTKMDAQFAAGISGYLLWNWKTWGKSCDFDISPGDPALDLIHDYPLGTSNPAPVVTTATTTTSTTAPPEPAPVVEPVVGNTTSVDDSILGKGLNQVAYSANWRRAEQPGLYQGSEHRSSTAGASFSMQFSGTGVTLYGMKARWHGKAAIKIDNGPETIVDYKHETEVLNEAIFTSPSLARGLHTITVTALGQLSHTLPVGEVGNTVTVDRLTVVS